MSYYDRLFAPGKIERSLAVVDGLRPIASRLGCTAGQLALAWCFHQSGVTSAIAGSRNPKHVRENAEVVIQFRLVGSGTGDGQERLIIGARALRVTGADAHQGEPFTEVQ